MNMNRAAEELYITQPALSLSISKLEKGLGIPLFHRNKNKLVLSAEAEMLLPYIEKYRQSHDLLVQEVTRLKEQSDQVINIAYSGSAYTFSMFYFSNILSNYEKAAVNMTYVDSKMAVSLLSSGQADFAISNSPLSHPLISSINLLVEPIGIVLPESHRLASHDSLTFEDIKKIKFHGLSTEHDFRKICDSICISQGVTPYYVSENEYTDYNLCMEKKDRNICFFSTEQNYQVNFKPLGGYIYKEVNNAILNRKINIYFMSNQKKQYQHEKLIELLQRIMIKQSMLTSKFSRIVNEVFLDESSYIEI